MPPWDGMGAACRGALAALVWLCMCSSPCGAANTAKQAALNSGSLNRAANVHCAPQEGSASFGILYGGDSALKLRPIELLRAETNVSWPVANPVLTASQLEGVDAITQPMLLSTPDAFLMFFAAHSCATGRFGIAVAQSGDGGLTWRPLGVVVQEEGADVRAPIVFQHNSNWYLVVERTGSGRVDLYKAKTFPQEWSRPRTILNRTLEGVNILRHNHKWWLVGSEKGRGMDGQDHVLVVLHAKSPLGPWKPHLNWDGTFAVEAARSMGRIFKFKNQLHRLGRSCQQGVCGKVEVLQLFLSEEAFEQDNVAMDLGQPLWRQRASWDSAGWSHLAMDKRLSDEAWLAVMEASSLPALQPVLPQRLQAAILAFKAQALLSILVLVITGAVRVPIVRSQLLRRRWGHSVLAWVLCPPSLKRAKVDETPPSSPALAKIPLPMASIRLIVHDTPGSPKVYAGSAAAAAAEKHGGSGRPRSNGGSTHRRGGGSSASSHGSAGKAAGMPPSCGLCGWGACWQQLSRRFPAWKAALATTALVLALCGVGAARFALSTAGPFLVQPHAVAVQGQYSRFTLMVMSYDARLQQLQWYVRHYSQCPSVGEILVVWNRGPPPDPHTFESAVPVRVRVEAVNSMNNRFRPDPNIKFRAVLSLDDDILIPCQTIEDTFARWRLSPQRLVGYYPRLLAPELAGGPPVLSFEEATFQKGAYNAILAGGAFMDSATFFPAYSSPAAEPARRLVDEVFNCDDLLLNFVVANWTAAGVSSGSLAADAVPVQLVRPQRRLDVSRFSGVGISHDLARFKAAADQCLAEFTRLFGGAPLVLQQIDKSVGRPNCRLWPFDCMYLTD